MLQKSSNQKTTQAISKTSNRAPAAGKDGAAIAPPTYGVDFLDRAQHKQEQSTGIMQRKFQRLEQNRDAADSQVIQRITADGLSDEFIEMDHWGYRQLNDGDSIGTDSMSTCVTLAIYNDSHLALIAHFGSGSLQVDPIKDVNNGATAIDAKIKTLGGKWAGWVFTGNKDHKISQKRISNLMKKFIFLTHEKSSHAGVTLTRSGDAIEPTWLAASDNVVALDLAM